MKPTITALMICLFAVATALAQDAKAPAADEWVVPARAAKKKNPVTTDDAALAKGKALYTKECLSCHGPAGKGDGPAVKDLEKKPGDLSSPKLWEQTDGALFFKVTEGRKPMPSMEKAFTEDERWLVINYVRTLAPKPASQTAASGR